MIRRTCSQIARNQDRSLIGIIAITFSTMVTAEPC